MTRSPWIATHADGTEAKPGDWIAESVRLAEVVSDTAVLVYFQVRTERENFGGGIVYAVDYGLRIARR